LEGQDFETIYDVKTGRLKIIDIQQEITDEIYLSIKKPGVCPASR